jgi:hypothetical protein
MMMCNMTQLDIDMAEKRYSPAHICQRYAVERSLSYSIHIDIYSIIK